MASTKAATTFLFFLFTILLGYFSLPGFVAEETVSHLQWNSNSPTEMNEKIASRGGLWRWRDRNSRRSMIGSTAPICTYNECRGCKYKCRAEQIPVDANDPINSAYHYRCVCHR